MLYSHFTVFVLVCEIFQQAESCTLPVELQGTWQDASLGKEITFTADKLIGYDVTLVGTTYSSFTCISNNGTVYVFKGDDTYFRFPFPSGNYPFYLCMKLVEVSDNLYYYHLLAEPDTSGFATTVFRMYLPLDFGVTGPDPATTPTCDYCSFTSPHAESEAIILQKSGTSETIPQSEATLCLPCESDCAVDIDECIENPDFCMNGICVNTDGSFQCICNTGYKLDSSGTQCVDIDECNDTPDLCTNGICVNSPGSFQCVCNTGYKLDNSGTQCVDINECNDILDLCTNGICVNSPGSFQCVCNTGYQLDNSGTQCVDIDECNDTPDLCTNGICVNSPGSFQCVCNTGYKLDNSGTQCVDIDECNDTPDLCTNGICVNSPGSFQCVCNTGYKLDNSGTQCVDIDECNDTPDLCTNGICVNSPGSFQCVCNNGYKLDNSGAQCIDIDECNDTPDLCTNGICVNSPGSFQCVCNTGYKLDNSGKQCVDIDECNDTPDLCTNGICVNSPGSFQCVCNTGYKLDNSGTQCVDIDECNDTPDLCTNGICVNSPGSFQCVCNTGYKLDNSGTQCVGTCHFPCSWQQAGFLKSYWMQYSDVVNQNEEGNVFEFFEFVFPPDSPSEMQWIFNGNQIRFFCHEISDQFIIARTPEDTYTCLQITEIPGDNFTLQILYNGDIKTTDKCVLCNGLAQAILLKAATTEPATPTLSDYVVNDCVTPRGCPCEGCDICTDSESTTLDLECPQPPTTEKPYAPPRPHCGKRKRKYRKYKSSKGY